MRKSLKTFRPIANRLVNGALRPLGVRLVNTQWGPRGFANSFSKLSTLGIQPRTILDVGAATGTWTQECMRVFPSASYILVDALAENEGPLRTFCNQHPNSRYLITALGSVPENRTMHVHGDQSSFFSSEYDRPGASKLLSIATLDHLMDQGKISAPEILKADVQGYELEVLKGAQRMLKHVEVVLLEVSFRRIYSGAPLADEVICTLRDIGFRIYDICTFAQRPSDGELAQADVVFARSDGLVFQDESYGSPPKDRRP